MPVALKLLRGNPGKRPLKRGFEPPQPLFAPLIRRNFWPATPERSGAAWLRAFTCSGF